MGEEMRRREETLTFNQPLNCPVLHFSRSRKDLIHKHTYCPHNISDPHRALAYLQHEQSKAEILISSETENNNTENIHIPKYKQTLLNTPPFCNMLNTKLRCAATKPQNKRSASECPAPFILFLLVSQMLILA